MGLKYVHTHHERPSLVLFLGPNIGMFRRSDALLFLQSIHKELHPQDKFFITFDLRKNFQTIYEAYEPSVSNNFCMNMLARINLELTGEFDLKKFFFYSYFDSVEGCIRNTVVSTIKQEVRVGKLNCSYKFEAFEALLVGESHKYTPDEIDKLA